LQSLPNLTRKKKAKIQLKEAQWCGCHLQQKEINKIIKDKLNYERHENELRWKEDHPKDPLTSANVGPNNIKIALTRMVIK
jgi:hypothetical protein